MYNQGRIELTNIITRITGNPKGINKKLQIRRPYQYFHHPEQCAIGKCVQDIVTRIKLWCSLYITYIELKRVVMCTLCGREIKCF